MHSRTMPGYGAIFDQRGADYDQAMHLQPDARNAEFMNLMTLAGPRPGDRVCDFPSGGGYLASFVSDDIHLTLLETSPVFFALCQARGHGTARLTTENHIPGADACFDTIVSLAGIHHNLDQAAFVRECARALRPGGALCVADVAADSGVARFLNGFVHEHGQTGHEGHFLDTGFLGHLEASGFIVESAQRKCYPWVFDSRKAMLDYCGLLFGLTHVPEHRLLAGLHDHVGFRDESERVLLNWELLFVRATRPLAGAGITEADR